MTINANLRLLHMLRTLPHPMGPFLRLSILIAASCILLTLAACQSTWGGKDVAPSALVLPNAVDVVPDPVDRPPVAVGEDLGIVARRYATYGDQNAKRLRDARQNYMDVRDAYK